MSATFNDGVATLYYIPGLGFSPASGGPVGGLGVPATPLKYSSTFFGSDVKGLLPPNTLFGHRHRRRRSHNKRSYGRRSRKRK